MMETTKARVQDGQDVKKRKSSQKKPSIPVVFRKATVHDTAAVKELVKMFHEEHIEDLGFEMSDLIFKKIATSNVLSTTWVAQLPNEPIPGTDDFKHGKVVGVFSGYYTTYILNNEKLFHEIVWYVHPEYRSIGMKLFDHCMHHIKLGGAKKMVLIHMATDKAEQLARLYESMGFRPLETHYVKEL